MQMLHTHTRTDVVVYIRFRFHAYQFVVDLFEAHNYT